MEGSDYNSFPVSMLTGRGKEEKLRALPAVSECIRMSIVVRPFKDKSLSVVNWVCSSVTDYNTYKCYLLNPWN
jgi:hypothetical protein